MQVPRFTLRGLIEGVVSMRLKLASTLLSAIILATAVVSNVFAGSYEHAEAAYNRGDYATAMRLLRPLAEQGYAIAQNHLGAIYEYGLGVPPDEAEAVKWYHKAAEQGHVDAQYNLGRIYAGFVFSSGLGAPLKEAEAAKWYRKAAEQGHVDAQYELGQIYAFRRDYVAAVKWYRRAAEQGHTQAQLDLGDMYAKGHGVPQSERRQQNGTARR